LEPVNFSPHGHIKLFTQRSFHLDLGGLCLAIVPHPLWLTRFLA
jgi:hypothetical protein